MTRAQPRASRTDHKTGNNKSFANSCLALLYGRRGLGERRWEERGVTGTAARRRQKGGAKSAPVPPLCPGSRDSICLLLYFRWRPARARRAAAKLVRAGVRFYPQSWRNAVNIHGM